MAADAIGDALVAKGLSVLTGTTLEQMAELIQNNLYLVPTVFTGAVKMNPYGTTTQEKSITFPTPFARIPTITVSSSAPTDVSATYKNVTVSGFIIVGKGGRDGASHSATISWRAQA